MLFCLIDIITSQKLIVLHIQFRYYHIHNNLKGIYLHNAANCQMLTSQTLSSCLILEKPVCLAAQHEKCQNRLTGLFNQKE